jgi:hypothetical protein
MIVTRTAKTRGTVTMTKETYYRGKRDLLQRMTKETYYRGKRDLL